MPQLKNIPAKHVLSGDILNGQVVKSIERRGKELLFTYRNGDQELIGFEQRVTVTR